mmetsp:Transcript_6163/g.24001  ORF Transcript_6163/g.24001 Transcript_6163/m.24001 type:complete len:376 (-) Transcript_6163:371-1498(-)
MDSAVELHLAPELRVRHQQHDGHRWPAATHEGREVGVLRGRHDDGGALDAFRGEHAGLGDGESRALAGILKANRIGQLILLQSGPAGGARLPPPALRLADHLAHELDALHRVQSLGRLAAEHDGVRPVVHRIRDVGDLRPRRPRILLHALQHLSGDDDGLASLVAQPHHLLLCVGHALHGDLDAEVSTSDHDPVAGLENIFKVVDRLRGLDLGNDQGRERVRPEVVLLHLVRHEGPDGLDVTGFAHKRRGDEVHVVLDAIGNVHLVLLRHRRKVHLRARKVDAAPVAERAAVLHLAHHVLCRLAQDSELDEPIVEQNGAAHVNRLGQLLVGLVQLLRGAVLPEGLVDGERDGLAGDQLHLSAFHVAGADLRPFGV